MIDPLVIPIAGIILPVVLVPVILGIRQAKYERQLEHAERMKALELGRSLPQDESWWTLPRISVAIGAGVPTALFFCAWQTSDSHTGDPEVAWVAASIVSLVAVVCGTGLAGWHFFRRESSTAAGRCGDFAKASFDADAFDVVGSRG